MASGQLSNRILASVLAILVATTVVGFVLDTFSQRPSSSTIPAACARDRADVRGMPSIREHSSDTTRRPAA